MKSKTFIFGASKLGRNTYEIIKEKYNVLAFIDNDANKWNTSFCDLKILNPQILNKTDNKIMLVIASQYYEEIINQLSGMNIYNYILSPVIASPYSQDLNRFRFILKQINYIDEYISFSNNELLINRQYIEERISCIQNIIIYIEFKNCEDLCRNMKIMKAYLKQNKSFNESKADILKINNSIKYLIKKSIFQEVYNHWYELI